MSKSNKKKDEQPEPVKVTAYAVISDGLGFQIVQLEIVDGVVVSANKDAAADVWAITVNNLVKTIRSNLGLS